MKNLHIREKDSEYLSYPTERAGAAESAATPHLQPDPMFVISGHEQFLDSADKLCQSWDMEVRHLMHQYGVLSESQLFSGTAQRVKQQDNNMNHPNRINPKVYLI